MNVMWLFFAWSLIAALFMAAVAVPAFLGGGLSGDSSIVFGLSALAGIPAWLIVAALTIARWNRTAKPIAALHNAPGALALVLYGAAHVLWAA